MGFRDELLLALALSLCRAAKAALAEALAAVERGAAASAGTSGGASTVAAVALPRDFERDRGGDGGMLPCMLRVVCAVEWGTGAVEGDAACACAADALGCRELGRNAAVPTSLVGCR